MKIHSLAAAVLVLAQGSLSAQELRSSSILEDIRFKDVRAAALPGAQGPVETLIKVLASDARLEDKLSAVAAVQSTDLREFDHWGGRMDPQAEYQVALALKNVVEWPAADISTRFKGVAVYGRLGRWFRYTAAQDLAIATLKDLASWSSPNQPEYGLGREALLGLASMAKAAPIRGMDPQWPDKVVGLAEDVLYRYLGGVVTDPVGQEAFAGLAILHNYLEFNLLDSAGGNREGGWNDRVERMPSMSANLSWRLSSVLIDPVERDIERLYSEPNTYFRGYFVETLLDLRRVEMMDLGTLEKIRRVLTAMARHPEPNPRIYAELAPYRR